MTTQQTTLILMKITGAYFSQDKFLNSEDYKRRLTTWDVFFKDFSYNVVNQAVTEWIAEHKEMPQIANLLQRCKDLRELENYPKGNPMEWKSYAEQITIARKGDPDTWEDPEWLAPMREAFIEQLKKEQADSLPYEI